MAVLGAVLLARLVAAFGTAFWTRPGGFSMRGHLLQRKLSPPPRGLPPFSREVQHRWRFHEASLAAPSRCARPMGLRDPRAQPFELPANRLSDRQIPGARSSAG